MNATRTFVALSAAALLAACAGPGATTAPLAASGMAHPHKGPHAAMSAPDPRMKAMQEMHQKMMNAKTPAERQALMADHMKAAQDGMAMMREMHAMHHRGAMGPMGSASGAAPMAGMGMGKGMSHDPAKHHHAMSDHMEMMQMMMDMMVDRMPPAGAGNK